MKTRRQIQFDYNQTKRLAQSLRDTAQELRTLAQRDMQNNMAFVSQSWEGDNASNYLRKEAIVASDIEAQARSLIDVAEAIESSARVIYNSEMRAAELADTLMGET